MAVVEAQKGSSENEGDKSKMVVVVLGLVASHSKLSQGGAKQSNIRRARVKNHDRRNYFPFRSSQQLPNLSL